MAIGQDLGVQPQRPEGHKGNVFGRIHGCLKFFNALRGNVVMKVSIRGIISMNS